MKFLQLKPVRIVLIAVFTVILCISLYKIISQWVSERKAQKRFNELSAIVGSLDGMFSFEQLDELSDVNPDLFGWLTIDGTTIDYPVMFTPSDPQYYLRRDFYGNYSKYGVPFIDADCPPGGNFYLIYGHNMKSRQMFGSLTDYADMSFWETHHTIRFNTYNEGRVYEVMAAFYTKIYYNTEDGTFRYHEYRDLRDEGIFNEYIRGVKALAKYDTGITAEYGDEIIALSTCEYSTENGRFVVVAKRIQ